jgi:hypothetical protein
MARLVVARWKEWDGEGLEHLALAERPDGATAEAVLFATAGGAPFGARYRILIDAEGNTRRAEVARVGEDRGVLLEHDGAGNWSSPSAGAIPALQGARDVDISATPFTNTLPIRRLRLAKGTSRDILAAWVRLPSLALGAVRQRYTCLEPDRRYRFEDLDSGFSAELEVDGHGLVVTYPGLFRRLC